MYFRVPSNWTVFSEKQIIDSLPKPPSAASIPAIEAVNFEQIFAAPGAPSKVTSIGFQNATPVGTVTAGLLSASERDSFSLASLRSLVLGVDPMNTLSGSGGASTSGDTVVNYQEFVKPGGYRGSTMTVQVKSGGHPFEFTQSAVVDPGTNWVYFIAVGCADACFKSNAASIAQVVSSWNVKAVTK
ncbi:MAG: hypothetical protein ACP5PJ_07460 [Acidimicrobiales bacterium]